MTDYLNPERIYTAPRIDVPPGFDSIRVGVSNLESTTPTVKDRHNIHVGLELGDNGEVIRVNPTVKDSLTTDDYSIVPDEVAYSTPICSGKCCAAAPVREKLTTAESAEKCRVGEPGYPTANGRQVKNGTGIEEIERGTLDLQVGTAKPVTETVPNCGTETRQSAEWAAKGVTVTTASSHGAPITYQAIQFPGPCTVATPFFEACAWCGPERIGWFSVQFWVRSDYGKRKWMSVTQQYKHQVRYCPMCGKKVEGSK